MNMSDAMQRRQVLLESRRSVPRSQRQGETMTQQINAVRWVWIEDFGGHLLQKMSHFFLGHPEPSQLTSYCMAYLMLTSQEPIPVNHETV